MTKVIYFTYDGLLDPLGQSQIMPYLSILAAGGHAFTIVSYEKSERTEKQIESLDNKLRSMKISWTRLEFKTGKIFAIKRIINGILLIRKFCYKIQPDFVHLRGFVPALIFILSLSKVRYLYDFRGFALGEWIDIGKIKQSGILYRILKIIDQSAVKNASGLVVLEDSAKRLLLSTYDVHNVPLKVIRTCTDVTCYRRCENIPVRMDNGDLRFVFLGGARFPYRPDLALRLVQCLINHGINCYIDFVNERDHAIIKNAIDLIDITKDRVRILVSDHHEIPDLLSTYHCGIIAIEPSQWRRVCSPTKLGEYLAAGLPVISLEGIDAIDELSKATACVTTVSNEELQGGFQQDRVDRIIEFIQRPGAGLQCQQLARDEFDLKKAGKLYTELYDEIEMRISKF